MLGATSVADEVIVTAAAGTGVAVLPTMTRGDTEPTTEPTAA